MRSPLGSKQRDDVSWVSRTFLELEAVFACISSPFVVCQKQPNHKDAPLVRHVAGIELLRLGAFCPPSFTEISQRGSLGLFVRSLAKDVEWSWRTNAFERRGKCPIHMPTQKLTDEIINAAIEGFESQKRRIDSKIDELRQLLSTDRSEAAPPPGAPAPKRKISAAGRRRMAAAQQARWAKVRGEAEPPSSPATPKPTKQKRKLSAAGREAISEASKRRWALKRAEAQKPQATVAKKAAKAPAKAAKKTSGKKLRKKSPKTSESAVTAAAQ